MKFILLAPSPEPKHETAHYRPKTLGEHKLAFLNANNAHGWAQDEVPAEVMQRRFKSWKQAYKALRAQKLHMRRVDRQQELQNKQRRMWRTLDALVGADLNTLLGSQLASRCLSQSQLTLAAADYFERRCELLQLLHQKEIDETYVYSIDIEDYLDILDRSK